MRKQARCRNAVFLTTDAVLLQRRVQRQSGAERYAFMPTARNELAILIRSAGAPRVRYTQRFIRKAMRSGRARADPPAAAVRVTENARQMARRQARARERAGSAFRGAARARRELRAGVPFFARQRVTVTAPPCASLYGARRKRRDAAQ